MTDEQRPDRWDETWDDEPALLGELGRALGHDPEAVPPPDRVEALRARAAAMRGAEVTELRSRSRRRALLTGGIAAGVGGIAGYLLHDISTEQPAPQATVPMESIAFTGESADVTTSALINHTWGTELVIDLSGLAPGTAYDVVFETTGGEVAAGSLLAVADALMKCRFNAAPLRADVRAIELRSPAGDAVLRSDLPDVPDKKA